MSAKKKLKEQLNLWHWLLILFVLSAVFSVFYNWLSDQNEYRNRQVFAENLVKGDDEKATKFFEQWISFVRQDSTILCEKTDGYIKIDHLRYALESSFFKEYAVEFLFCNADEYLILQDGRTIVNCHEYFDERSRRQGRPMANGNLFKINQDPFNFGYFGIIRISDYQELYIEFVSRERTSWLQNTLKENRYSVAYYDRSEVVKQIGLFAYPLKLFTPKNKQNKTFSEYENYSHFQILINDSDDERVLIVSSRIPRLQSRLSTFSFVFILNLCLGLLTLLVWKRASRRLFKTFAQRLQVTVLAIVLATFVLVGIMSVIYVQRLNSQKNQKVLREKTYSLLLMMEQAFGDENSVEILDNLLLQEKLVEFSNVSFSDIFFYDETGHIIAKSSIEEVFQNTARDEMDMQAFHQLSREHKNFYVQKETLNNQIYYSSYVPFRNFRNELVGYLNLPHFTQQAELRQEIIAFVEAYINLFAVLIILVFTLVFLIIKRLTKPLIDSERQIAWSEMAKQIAHEIKNPLTPMKLSVQQIQKTWSGEKGDFGDRLKRFSTVMIEQIDTLSAIASEFSNFAQQSNTELIEVNVKNCLENVILLMNTDGIIRFEIAENTENIAVLADEKQLSRALINILKNAKQAVSEIETPHINVSLTGSKIGVVVAIRNNGKGISPEIQSRIFEPSFTTKTSGMGLGLAITKNIIEQFGGTISFETDETGTVFFVDLPALKIEKK